jgi:hypothetical protein
MATKLKGLKITSTDLVTAGANPEAHIRLFKRKDAPEGGSLPETFLQKAVTALREAFNKSDDIVTKDATTFGENIDRKHLRELTGEMFDFCYALSDSLCSIICDSDLTEDGKRGLMYASLDEFAETMRTAALKWAAGHSAASGVSKLAKPQDQQAAFAALWRRYEKSAGGGASDEPASEPEGSDRGNNQNHKEETNTMKIDKSRMTVEEQATLAEFGKKYGIADTPGADNVTLPADGGVTKAAEETGTGTTPPDGPEIHPEVKKALADMEAVRKAQSAEIEALKKSLEIERLTGAVKKYELIGKKAKELAPKLYELKKAGGTAYDDYVALLDEHLTTVEKSGLFAEYGRNTSGSMGTAAELGIKAAEIVKSASGVSGAAAIVRAFEENPELAAKYDDDYRGGKL